MRPEIITRELIAEICNYIAAGYSYSAAAKLAGIAESTFFRWRVMGQLEGAEDIYKVFYIEVEDASAFPEAEALQLVRSERRLPERYQRRNNKSESHKPDDESGALVAC
jgi:hypothetical protein